MALFTDSNISTLDDLRQYDSGILEVAKVEGVEISSKVQLAERELGLELETFLLRHQNVGGSWLGDSSYELGQVVVTPGLKQWHTLKALAMVYGDVFNNQLNDRYKGKWEQYEKLSKRSSELLFQTGVGVVLSPLPRASRPQVTGVGGGGLVTTYVIGVGWRNGCGARGAVSEAVVYEASVGEMPAVLAVEPPAGAISYDVYAGLSEEEMTLQNGAPVAVGEVWTMPVSGLVPGAAPGSGQGADLFLRLNRVLQRG